MHDIRAIRENPDSYVHGWSLRGPTDAAAVVAELLDLDERLRAAQTGGQTAQARRNELSKGIGQAKARGDEAEAARLLAEVEALKAEGAAGAQVEKELVEQLRDRLAALLNLAAADVPEGEDESGNLEQRTWGEPRRGGPAKDHVDLGEALGLMDFEAAARMSGARFVVLKGQLARLERALAQFMLDLQTSEHGYTEVSPPVLVRDNALFGTGQLPKFEEDLFATGLSDAQVREIESHLTHYRPELDTVFSFSIQREGDRRFLIPTAEVSLTNLVREQITPAEQLPLRLTACTPCFRAEAGASGRDTRGMIRQHQFLKVELVSITAPEDSEAEHERMTRC
ncbi:MAG: serine--tRNA ligase, partial [Proteobacteria bacterium]|nr:serine--tRNA ligase [Pseudomonadota bacterium]